MIERGRNGKENNKDNLSLKGVVDATLRRRTRR